MLSLSEAWCEKKNEGRWVPFLALKRLRFGLGGMHMELILIFCLGTRREQLLYIDSAVLSLLRGSERVEEIPFWLQV